MKQNDGRMIVFIEKPGITSHTKTFQGHDCRKRIRRVLQHDRPIKRHAGMFKEILIATVTFHSMACIIICGSRLRQSVWSRTMWALLCVGSWGLRNEGYRCCSIKDFAPGRLFLDECKASHCRCPTIRSTDCRSTKTLQLRIKTEFLFQINYKFVQSTRYRVT